MLYRLLKFLISIGIRLYYKEVRVLNRRNLPQKGPLIIISNHPNTLMDAWVLGMICKQPIYYMAKATLFDSKFKLKILKSLNLIPINRQGEGFIKGVSNDDSLNECYRILSEGKTLVIFPEGTSYKERVLRKLKSGTARIALETEKRNNGKLGLQVVAVGLNYSQPEKFRSRILIDVDKPRGVVEFLDEYRENGRSAAQKLTTQFRTRLENVLLTSETKEEEALLDAIYQVINSKNVPSNGKGVRGEVKQMKEIKNRIDEIKILQPWLLTEIHLKIRAINWKFQKMKIRADFLDRNFKYRLFLQQTLISLFFVLLALPVFIIGVVHHFIQFKLTDWIIPKLSKDIEYYAPFAVFLGLFIYPIFYAGFLFLAHILFGLSWTGMLIYLIVLPLSGLFAYWFLRYLRHISNKWHYIFLMVDRKEALIELQKEKLKLKQLIFDE